MVANRMVLTSPGGPGSQSNRVSEATALAFFLQDELEFGAWKLSPGVRYETIDFTRTDYATDDPNRFAPTRVRQNDVSILIPGLGVSYAVGDQVRLFGGVHRGFGPPGPGADQETRSETSVNYELGARYHSGEISAQVAGFFSDYNNVLGAATLSTGADGSGNMFNGGAVGVYGVEVSLDYAPVPWGGRSVTFPVNLAFTYTNAEFKTAFESDLDAWGTVQPGDRLPYLPRVQSHLSLGAEHRLWTVSVGMNYSAAMLTVAGQGSTPADERTDAFVSMSASADYAVTAWSSLYMGVQNLFNETYVVARRPSGVRPGLPRTILGGVRIRR